MPLLFQNCAGNSAGSDSLATSVSNSLAPTNQNPGGGDPYTGIIKVPMDMPVFRGGDGTDRFTEYVSGELCPLDGTFAFRIKIFSQSDIKLVRSNCQNVDVSVEASELQFFQLDEEIILEFNGRTYRDVQSF